jgi:4-hydroxy-tetrahydrodipicolinate synthase
MQQTIDRERLAGVWSATPTPLTDTLTLDADSVPRLVAHHLRLGVRGLFLGGTCGEGPWLRRADLRRLVCETAAASAGRLVLAVQITDNSVGRMLENAEQAAADGADIAVIAPPHFLLNATEENVRTLYVETLRRCPLPVGIYDRGNGGSVPVSASVLAAVYAEPAVVLVKDSSMDPARRDIALQARQQRPDLRLLTGDEFDVASYMLHGYNGALLGGGIFNGRLAALILAACAKGDADGAQALQERMNRLMWEVYGGPQITCWLTGLKELLVRMGIFSTRRNVLNYPLTESCSQAIDRVMEQDRDVLLP